MAKKTYFSFVFHIQKKFSETTFTKLSSMPYVSMDSAGFSNFFQYHANLNKSKNDLITPNG